MIALRTGVLAVPAILSHTGMASKRPITSYILNYMANPLRVSSGRSFASAIIAQDSKKYLDHYRPMQMPSLNFASGHRNYVTKKTEQVPATSPTTASNLLQREQLEKIFFRVVAFLWDCSHIMLTWLRKMAKVHIVEDPTVRFYWKRFHEKMEQSKKDV